MLMKKERFLSFFFVMLLFTSCLPSAYAMARRPRTFPVSLSVDFGPAGKPGFEDKHFHVEKGTSPKEAVSQVFPILSGKACCSLREIIEIGGVRIDPVKNRWWICELNGSRRFSPVKKKLKPGDVVAWKYI